MRNSAASPVLLIVFDGFGEGKANRGNAITRAKMKNLNRLRKTNPWTLLKASGNAVGLPKGYQGNSEVGHFTMGSGRITFQSLEAINRSTKDKSFFKKECLVKACQQIYESNKKGKKNALHLVGMISDEGVHSHIDHLFALLELAKQQKTSPIFIHAILDGRDVPQRSAKKYLKKIQQKIIELKVNAEIASVIGRYYAMDRDSNWDRTQIAYDLLVHGKGKLAQDPIQAVEEAYKEGAETDYYVKPILLDKKGCIRPGDSVIFFNYRTDRSRQLTEAFVDKSFKSFPTSHRKIFFVAMGPYTKEAPVAFPTTAIKNNLGQILSAHKIEQLRMAETEKYAHVTYFFNSQVEKPNPLEDREMIDSPKCASYDEKPEMSAQPLTKRLLKEIRTERYPFIMVNYANADLVGHSGNLNATIQCCKVLDECLGEIVPMALHHHYTILLTSDHGNAEQMFYPDGSPCPAHTTNPVLFLMISKNTSKIQLKKKKGLQDLAPTILELMNIKKTKEMDGESLIKKD